VCADYCALRADGVIELPQLTHATPPGVAFFGAPVTAKHPQKERP
jgi:hypothetical protein